MRNRILAIALMGIAAACTPTEEDARKQKIEANRAATEAGVRRVLKDPDSAKIVIHQAFAMFDGTIVCGMVNAKNSFGGYTGDRAFTISIDADGSAGTPSIAQDDVSSAVSAEMCDFQRDYAAQPGHVGKAVTPEQSRQLMAAYTKRVREVVARINTGR